MEIELPQIFSEDGLAQQAFEQYVHGNEEDDYFKANGKPGPLCAIVRLKLRSLQVMCHDFREELRPEGLPILLEETSLTLVVGNILVMFSVTGVKDPARGTQHSQTMAQLLGDKLAMVLARGLRLVDPPPTSTYHPLVTLLSLSGSPSLGRAMTDAAVVSLLILLAFGLWHFFRRPAPSWVVRRCPAWLAHLFRSRNASKKRKQQQHQLSESHPSVPLAPPLSPPKEVMMPSPGKQATTPKKPAPSSSSLVQKSSKLQQKTRPGPPARPLSIGGGLVSPPVTGMARYPLPDPGALRLATATIAPLCSKLKLGSVWHAGMPPLTAAHPPLNGLPTPPSKSESSSPKGIRRSSGRSPESPLSSKPERSPPLPPASPPTFSRPRPLLRGHSSPEFTLPTDAPTATTPSASVSPLPHSAKFPTRSLHPTTVMYHHGPHEQLQYRSQQQPFSHLQGIGLPAAHVTMYQHPLQLGMPYPAVIPVFPFPPIQPAMYIATSSEEDVLLMMMMITEDRQQVPLPWVSIPPQQLKPYDANLLHRLMEAEFWLPEEHVPDTPQPQTPAPAPDSRVTSKARQFCFVCSQPGHSGHVSSTTSTTHKKEKEN